MFKIAWHKYSRQCGKNREIHGMQIYSFSWTTYDASFKLLVIMFAKETVIVWHVEVTVFFGPGCFAEGKMKNY